MKEGYPPGFGPAELTSDASLLSTPPVIAYKTLDNDSFTAAHRLDNFTKQVLRKTASSLIRDLPKVASPAKAVHPMRSKSLTS